MRPLYIFDLDGTLADCSHRLPYIKGDKKDWSGFFAACAHDKPIEPVIRTLKALVRTGEVWIWTGRSDEVRNETTKWIHDHVGAFHSFWNPMRAPEALMMRAAGDHQADHTLKYGWLSNLEPPERNRLTAVFEDRDQVVQMWRDAGVPCFQVAPGNF